MSSTSAILDADASALEKRASHEEHADLSTSNHLKNEASTRCSSNLWETDCSVEQTEICSDMIS